MKYILFLLGLVFSLNLQAQTTPSPDLATFGKEPTGIQGRKAYQTIQLQFCCPDDTTAKNLMYIYAPTGESCVELGPCRVTYEERHPHPIGEYITVFFVSYDSDENGIPVWYCYCVINPWGIESYEFHMKNLIVYDGGSVNDIFRLPRPDACSQLANWCQF